MITNFANNELGLSRSLKSFKTGDIIYIKGNADYYDAICEISTSITKTGEKSTFQSSKAVFLEGSDWNTYPNETIYFEKGMRCRLAIEEEIDILNEAMNEI